MIILGIETSCDETAAAIVDGGSAGTQNVGTQNVGTQNFVFLRSNVVSSQIEIHKKYGGVVPEVAAREHVLNILPVVNEALEKAGIKRENAGKKINAIAVTIGPGLITSLIVGVETAKVLSYVWNVPVIGVNHIEGHIYANFISANSPPEADQPWAGKQIQNTKYKIQNNIKFPAVVLTVSGGHTMLVLMKGHGKYKIIGETRDDAAGEAFDKAAKLLGIGYPGGPEIAAEAAKFSISNFPRPRTAQRGRQFPNKIRLPRPMIYSKDYDFSFSGLKTALLYEIKKSPPTPLIKGGAGGIGIPEYCHEFQQAVIDVLIHKTVKAAEKYGVKTVMLAGGVAANFELRKQMEKTIRTLIPNSQFLIPALQYTTDNAAMVAVAGYYKALRKEFTPWRKLKVDANLELK
ncbi:tRNA (adenosine(37)-N6)-threonylcarbamoyltransferase complex transferase subunit TsaD [Patescibacteria group bacterium]|nr:tRNA (adenosine(37)-N6)-threonylcarbamoyltransferase complex transferase subunit TsaD [Patescibacteria group bacterium]